MQIFLRVLKGFQNFTRRCELFSQTASLLPFPNKWSAAYSLLVFLSDKDRNLISK